MKWRVLYSTHTATWFHARETAFVEAETAGHARSIVESLSDPGVRHEVWDVQASTDRMEADYAALKAKQLAWREAVARGENPRGVL